MSVDTYTSDRLRSVEKQLRELQSELRRERSDREFTITMVLSAVPALVVWGIVISQAVAGR